MDLQQLLKGHFPLHNWLLWTCNQMFGSLSSCLLDEASALAVAKEPLQDDAGSLDAMHHKYWQSPKCRELSNCAIV